MCCSDIFDLETGIERNEVYSHIFFSNEKKLFLNRASGGTRGKSESEKRESARVDIGFESIVIRY